MTVASFDELAVHAGHEVSVRTCGTSPASAVAVECRSCGEILFDYDEGEVEE